MNRSRFKLTLRFGTLLTLALLTGLTQARLEITFWHSMEDVEETVNALAQTFNDTQDSYRLTARYMGSYRESQTRLVGALGTASEPVLYQAEIAFFPRLVADGALRPLDAFTNELSSELLEDIYPGLWAYGEMDGARYGLPWNSSTPVLYYNASAFRQRGLEPPETWDDFVHAAERLTTRRTQGFIAMSESWIFELMVTTRGGNLVTETGEPNFTSPEAIAALTMLRDLTQQRHAIPRSYAEVTYAMLDFVRTRGMMIFGSIANWPSARRFSIGFDVAAAPVPTGGSQAVPLGGAQLVIPRGASDEEVAGAIAFWEFLMEPENVASWVRASYYIPVRRAALPLLDAWYDEDPNRRAALEQLEHAQPRPRVAAFSDWRNYLDEAIERVIKGGADPERALQEAQQQALSGR